MQYDMARVLVTGGAGFVGSNLVRKLVEMGSYVTVIDDMFTGSMSNLDGVDDYRFVEMSVTDKAIEDYVKHSDIVFHLAARNIIASTSNPVEDYMTNIGGTLNILMAVKEHPIERMVYTSSASVYGNPKYLPINETDSIDLLTPYAVSKYAGEGYCMAFHESYDIPVTVLRLSNVYGHGQSPKNPYCGVVAKFMDCVYKRNDIEIHGDGLSTRDFTYIDDVVDALLIAGISPRSEGEVFNVATGIETSVEELAMNVMMTCLEESDEGEINIAYVNRRDIDNIRRRVMNVEKIRRKLNWSPTTILREGLFLTNQWMKNVGQLP